MRKGVLGIIGVLLIVLGAVALIYQGITYTDREELVDIGDLEIQAESRKQLPLSQLLGGLALAGGVVLVVASRKSSG